MAWVDCMRLRRVATIIRAVGWTVAGFMFSVAVIGAFTVDGDQTIAMFAVVGAAASIMVLAITYALAWVVDRRGDRLVTR